jgi:hypothetical protein
VSERCHSAKSIGSRPGPILNSNLSGESVWALSEAAPDPPSQTPFRSARPGAMNSEIQISVDASYHLPPAFLATAEGSAHHCAVQDPCGELPCGAIRRRTMPFIKVFYRCRHSRVSRFPGSLAHVAKLVGLWPRARRNNLQRWTSAGRWGPVWGPAEHDYLRALILFWNNP